MKKEKFFLSIIILAFIDQLSKLFIIINKNNFPIVIINDALEITYCENKGIAFGIGDGLTLLISIVTAIIMGLILVLIYKNYNKIEKKLLIGAALLISGGLGNFLDRIFRRHVVDFIYFKLINFPVFNFADICIVVGVIIIGIGFILADRGENIEKNNSTNK